MPVIELPDRKNRERRNARIRRNNQMLRSRNKMQRARILSDKADDLRPGRRKTRLTDEAAELVKEARALRKKAKNASPVKPTKTVAAKKAAQRGARANASTPQKARSRAQQKK